MSSIAIITGITGETPECHEIGKNAAGEKTLATAFPVVSFERSFNSASGEFTTKRVYHRCVAYGATAERIAKYFSKGKGIQVTGRINYRIWNNGTTNLKVTEIIVDQFHFVGAAEDAKESQQSNSQQSTAQTPQQPEKAHRPAGQVTGYVVQPYLMAAAPLPTPAKKPQQAAPQARKVEEPEPCFAELPEPEAPF